MSNAAPRAFTALALAALSACGTDFYEPNPPGLSSLTRRASSRSQAEPTVYLLILDLYMPSAASCDVARQDLIRLVSGAIHGRDPEATVLPLEMLPPTCSQAPFRRLALGGYPQAIEALEVKLGRRIRPLILYVNNVDLALPTSLSGDITQLHATVTEGGLSPFVWGITTARVKNQLGFLDRAIDWTFSGDPSLEAAFTATVAADLPLLTRTGSGEEIPLLDADQLATVQQLKICSDASIEARGFVLDGSAVVVRREDPPRFVTHFSPLLAVPRTAYSDQTVALSMELCTANCDRFLEDPALRTRRAWNRFHGCVLGAP